MKKSNGCDEKIQAYKLYIKESLLNNEVKNKPQRKNFFIIQFLQSFKDGFQLTRSNMDKLINLAKKKGFKFRDGDSFKGSTHGRSILDGLNDLEKNTSLKHLEDFAYLLGLVGYEEEFCKSDLEEIFKQKVKKKNEENREKGHGIYGVYCGYYLDKHFGDNDERALRTLLLQINGTGKVLVDDGEPSHSPHEGRMFTTKHEQIIVINGDYTFDGSGIPRYTIILKMPQENNFSEIEGIAGGYSKKNIPTMTLIKFIKTEYNSIEQAKIFEPIKNYTLDKQKSSNLKIDDGIINFFFKNPFDNSHHECIARELKLKYRDDNFKNAVGLYWIFSTSSEKKGMVQYPVLINNDGSVQIKIKDQEIKKGKMKLYPPQKALIIDFITDYDYNEGSSFMGAFLFYIENIKKGLSPGVSMRINNDLQPQAKREYIMQYKINGECVKDPEALTIKFEEAKFKFFYYKDPIYENLKRSQPNIDNLFGREYNLIVETRDTINPAKILQREKFAKIYYYQSLFEFLKAKNKVSDEVEHFFELAMEHGLFIDERLSDYSNEFCKTLKINGPDANKMEKTFRALFNKFSKKYLAS